MSLILSLLLYNYSNVSLSILSNEYYLSDNKLLYFLKFTNVFSFMLYL